jgi:hypothetical protein
MHLDNLCNKNQLAALVFLNLHVSGMFIAHHHGVFTVYFQQLVRVVRLGDCLSADKGKGKSQPITGHQGPRWGVVV